MIFSIVLEVAAAILDSFLALGLGGVLPLVFALVITVPSITVAIRRMHDLGRSGWWILIPVVSFVFLCLDSQPGENEYGPNPKLA